MRSKYILITVVLLTLGFGLGRLSAAPGTLDYPDVPGNTLSYTLEDIYHRLDTGAAGAQSTFTEPAAGPGTGTMHTLNDIMAEAPAADNTDGAGPGEVLDGKSYWSLRTDGTWGTQTGTMPDREGDNASTAQDRPGAVSYFTAPEGYYDGDDRVSATDAEVRALDADITAGNIKKDVNIFGQVGTLTPGGAATAADLFDSKTAHLAGDWTLDTGTLDLACNNPTFDGTDNLVADAYDGSGDGSSRWCMTDSGDATEADIVSGKVAWVDGIEVTGTLPNKTRVPKTGQTDCWDETGIITPCTGTGQDGEYQLGLLPERDPAVQGAYTVYGWAGTPRFRDNGDGTVTDNLTGLTWLKDANCIQTQYPGFDEDLREGDTVGDGRVSQQHALEFVAGINAGTYSDCGASQTDWRLPNVNELHSLFDLRWSAPALPDTAGTGQWSEGDPFTGVQFSSDWPYCWSSTTDASSTAAAWYVGLTGGSVGCQDKASSWLFFYVWPVRGGQ